MLFANTLDLSLGHRCRRGAEPSPHIRRDGCDLAIGQHSAETRHLAVVFLSGNHHPPLHAMQHNANEPFGRTQHPWRALQRRGFAHPLIVVLMASRAVAVE